jgi:hypothetical protein
MLRRILVSLLLAGSLVLPAMAQQHQDPGTQEFKTSPLPPEPRERPWNGYAFSTVMEFGWQQAEVTDRSNLNVYRSQVYYQNNGPRLFELNFQGRSETGFFKRIWATGGGWGGDPYNWARYGLENDDWFIFRANYLRSDYFFNLPTFALNQHTNDTERRRQSYDLTLFPKWPVRARLGYSRNTSNGFTLTTFDFSRDEFLMFEPLRQTADEYRFGLEGRIQRWNFFADYNWRHFRNDRNVNLPGFSLGNNPAGTTQLNSAARSYPIRGHIPFVRFTLAGRPHRKLDVSSRLLYSDPEIDFLRTEAVNGRTFDPSGPPLPSLIVQQIDSFGDGGRPNVVSDTAVTWKPHSRVSFSNTLRFNRFTIAGSDLTRIRSTCTPPGAACTTGTVLEEPHNRLRVSHLLDRFEGRVDATDWLGFRAGFRLTDRDVQMAHFDAGILEELEVSDLSTQSFLVGFNLRPVRQFKLFLDYERGEFDNTFTRVSPAEVDQFRIRGRFEPTRGVNLNMSWFIFDNDVPNPTVVSIQKNRGVALDFALNRWSRWFWNLGYTRNDISTRTDITFFIANIQRFGTSFYIANDNYAYSDFGGQIYKGLHGELGYRVLTNTGTFPLNFHQPHASLRYDFNERVSARVGYRWYGYNEKNTSSNDYRTHIVAISLRLTL